MQKLEIKYFLKQINGEIISIIWKDGMILRSMCRNHFSLEWEDRK